MLISLMSIIYVYVKTIIYYYWMIQYARLVLVEIVQIIQTVVVKCVYKPKCEWWLGVRHLIVLVAYPSTANYHLPTSL